MVRDVNQALNEFEERWNEAKTSGKTAVLFQQNRWHMIDLLLEEAKRAQELQGALDAEGARVGKLQAAYDLENDRIQVMTLELGRESERVRSLERARANDADHIGELQKEVDDMRKGIAILRRDLIASRAMKRTKKHEPVDDEPLFDKGAGKVLNFPVAG